MPRKVILIPLAVVAAVCVAVLAAAAWRQADTGPAIQTKALGVWQEQTESNPFRMTVSAAPEGSGETDFWVTYPGSIATPFPARLDGERILVWGENTQAVGVGDHLRRRRRHAARHAPLDRRAAHPAAGLNLTPPAQPRRRA